MQPMMISELITQLQAFLQEHGDKPVFLEDADTNWTWKGKQDQFWMDSAGLHIGGDYGDERASKHVLDGNSPPNPAS